MNQVQSIMTSEIKKLFITIVTLFISGTNCSISFVKKSSDRYKMLIRGLNESIFSRLFSNDNYSYEYDRYVIENEGIPTEYIDFYVVKDITESSMMMVKSEFDSNGFSQLAEVVSVEYKLKCYRFNDCDVVATPWSLDKTIRWYNNQCDETTSLEEILNPDKEMFYGEDDSKISLSEELLKDEYKNLNEPVIVCSTEY